MEEDQKEISYESRPAKMSDFERLLMAQYLLKKLNAERKVLLGLLDELKREVNSRGKLINEKDRKINDLKRQVSTFQSTAQKATNEQIKKHPAYIELKSKYDLLKGSTVNAIISSFGNDDE